MKEIQYYAREVFGVRRCYIVDPTIEKIVLGLTRRKTLDTKDILCLKALGHELIQVLPPDTIKNN